MTNLAQLLLIVVISTLTFLIALVAIQVFQVLHEAKQAMKKFNKLLENTEYLSDAASKPIQSMNQFFSEVKGLVNTTENEVIESTPDRVITPQKTIADRETSVSSKRFFHRAGQMLKTNNAS